MRDSTPATDVGRAVSVAVVWLLGALLAAVALVASGLVPTLSVARTVSLLVAGGVLLALSALFVRYFDPRSGRLF